ncbi:hypothetical protein IF650_03980 [Cellulosimicrobium terreum]|nr:hypothetical protein [Cellulosimicrobium terreum]
MTNHARDDGEIRDGEGDELARALHELVDLAGEDAPTPLGAVRARVRRRRAVKKTAIGAATLGVVGVLAVGVAQLPSAPVAPVLPADPSPTAPGPAPSEPPVEPPDAVPDDVPDDATTAGFQPGWLAGTDLVCGMSVDAFTALTDPALSLTTDGPSPEVPGVVDVTLTNEGSTTLTGVTATVAPVAWVRDDVVVAVGPNQLESPLPLDLDAGETVSLGAEPVPTDYCSPGDDGLFTTPVPAGDYDLLPYQGVLRDGTSDGDEVWAVGTAVPVTLAADGTVAPRD